MFTAFDPNNPFPLVSLSEAEKQSAKDHAKAADAWIGFQIESVEVKVRAERHGDELAKFETWAHISPQIFLTPYLELRYWLDRLSPAAGTRIVDLGAGYGRMAFVLERHFSEVDFIGIECVPARVDEFDRVAPIHKLKHSKLIVGDLTNPNFNIPQADLYFVYDCGTHEAVTTVIDRISTIAQPSTQLLVRGLRACQAARGSANWQASTDFDYTQSPGLHAEIFSKR